MRHRWIPLLLLSLLAAPAPAVADEARQEEIAKRWVAAHNAGAEAMAAFRAEHFKKSEVGDWRAQYSRTREELGELEIYGVMIPEADVVLIGVRASEGRMRLRFGFHADAPDQIREISLDDAGGPAGARGAPALPELTLAEGWNERRAQIDAWLAGLAERDLFSGSVLVVERGEKRFEGAYGLGSREYGAPNTLATRFDVGSFNKDYTRLAIVQLMVAGKLALDDPVGRHLPDYPNEDVRKRVTIRQLLDHTSGLADYFDDDWRNTPMGNLREIDDYIPIWGPKPLIGEPGGRERYSNFGYTVLGAVIEKLSGMSYPDYVVERIFKPAGMHDSGFFEVDEIVSDVATGYTKMGEDGPLDRLRRNTFLEPAKGGPWGKSYSTAADLYRFFAAMFAGRFLPEEHNWLRGGWNSGGIALAGGGPGLNAFLLLEDGLMVIALANLDPPAAGRVAEALHRAIRR